MESPISLPKAILAFLATTPSSSTTEPSNPEEITSAVERIASSRLSALSVACCRDLATVFMATPDALPKAARPACSCSTWAALWSAPKAAVTANTLAARTA